MSLNLSNNPKTRRVYSLTFIIDIEEEEEEEHKIKVNFYSKKQLSLIISKNKRWFVVIAIYSIYSLQWLKP